MSWEDELVNAGLATYEELLGSGISDSTFMDDPSTTDMASGGFSDPAMAAMMGGAMGGRPGIPPAKLLSLMTNAAGGVKSGSPFGIPGPLQMPPDRDLSHKADDPNMIGLRGRQGGIVRTGVTPAGLAQAPGSIVSNNYPKLRGLSNQAYGVNSAPRLWS